MSPERQPAAPPSRGGGSLGFRLDIQGIRALAVLLVVANHLAPGRLPGGYIGVDVFFVVSGFLITSLLVAESERSGRISLAAFYARRARRILPAATVVVVATVVASMATMSMLRAQTILTDAIWATAFAANIRMAQVGTDYFAQGQPPSPLRHYWSLAVEEQFYLVWPILLGLLLMVLARRRARTAQTPAGLPAAELRRWAGLLIAVLLVGSLIWSVWATYSSPVTAYYSSLTRAWELAVGAACALLPQRLPLPSWARQLLAAGGLAGIVVASFLLSEETPFPSGWAAIPVLGTAAIILAGGGGASTAVGRGLSVAPMVRVGDWSYSMYLWHWPLIVTVRSALGPERFAQPPVILAVLAATVLLSWASFRWVETPFRTARLRPRRALLIYPVAFGLVLTTVLGGRQVIDYRLGGWSDAPPISAADYAPQTVGRDPFVALVRASALAAEEGRDVPGDLVPGLIDLRGQTAPLGDCDYRTGTTRLCPVGDPDADRSIVVLGDSRARALSPAVDEIGRTHGYRVYVLVYSGCSASALVQVNRETGRAWEECEAFKAWAQETIEELTPELVVVSTAAGRFAEPGTGDVLTGAAGRRYRDALAVGWTELFGRLTAAAERVAIVGNTPKLPRETGVCLSQGAPDLGDCAFPPGPAARREARLSFAVARESGVAVVDAEKWFCADGLCPSVVGRFITMRDSEHITPDYARWLAPALATDLGLGSARGS